MGNVGSLRRTVVTTDEQVIQGILQQLETSWNRYDSISFASAFAEDANFIHIFGGQLGDSWTGGLL